MASARKVLGRRESAAKHSLGAEEMEELVGDMDALDLLGAVASTEIESGPSGIEGRHILEHLGLPPPGVVLGYGSRRRAALRRAVHQNDDAIRLGKSQRLEQDRVDNGKNGSVGPDSEGQRGNRGGCEAGALAQSARSVPDISVELLQPCPAPYCAGFFRRSGQVSKFPPRPHFRERLEFFSHLPF